MPGPETASSITPLQPRLGEILTQELARAQVSAVTGPVAAERLLSTMRAFLAGGGPLAAPGFGRLQSFAPVPSTTPGAPGLALARIAPDPGLGGRWPHSLLDPHDFFEGRWTGLLYPKAALTSGKMLPRTLPLRHAPVPNVNEPVGRRLADALPMLLSMTFPEDERDAFNLNWLNDLALRATQALGQVYVIGSYRYDRALFFGSFDQGQRRLLVREDLAALFGRITLPQPRVRTAPRVFDPAVSVVVQTLLSRENAGRRLLAALSGGEIDLDGVASLWYSILDGHYSGLNKLPPSLALIQAVGLAWGAEEPDETIYRIVERSLDRLSREISSAPPPTALDLSPLGILMQIEEPEFPVNLPGPLGLVTLPAHTTWLLGWESSR